MLIQVWRVCVYHQKWKYKSNKISPTHLFFVVYKFYSKLFVGDISEFKNNVEWEVSSFYVKRVVTFYGCCPEPYPSKIQTFKNICEVGISKFQCKTGFS